MQSVKMLKTQSLLQEVLSTALSELNNPLINNLCVSRVECKKGKQHAKVFIESSGIEKDKREEILRALNKAKGILAQYTLSATSWFKCPEFSFVLDDSLSEAQSLEAIFAKIYAQSDCKNPKATAKEQ